MSAKKTKDKPKKGLIAIQNGKDLLTLIDLKNGNKNTYTLGVEKNQIDQTEEEIVDRGKKTFLVERVSDKSAENEDDFIASLNSQERCKIHVISLDSFCRLFAETEVYIVSQSKAITKKVVKKLREAGIFGHIDLLEEPGEDLEAKISEIKGALPDFGVGRGYRNTCYIEPSSNRGAKQSRPNDSTLYVLSKEATGFGITESLGRIRTMDEDEKNQFMFSDYISSFIPKMLFCLDFLSKYDFDDSAFKIRFNESEFSDIVYAESNEWVAGYPGLASVLSCYDNNPDQVHCWLAYAQMLLGYLKGSSQTVEDLLPKTKKSFELIKQSIPLTIVMGSNLIKQGLACYSNF